MKLVKTTLLSGIIVAIRTASGFVAGKIVAIFIGPVGIAVVGQFGNFLTIILTFANGAINNGVIKYTAENENDTNELKKIFSTSLKISFICSVFLGVILLIGASLFSNFLFGLPTFTGPLRVLGGTIIFYSLNNLLISILNGKKQIKTYTIVNMVGSIVGLIFTIVLVVNYKIQGALYALVLAQSIVFFVTLTLILKSDWFSLSFFNQKFDKAIAKKLSSFSLMTVVTVMTAPVAQIVLRNMMINRFQLSGAGYWQAMMRISDGYLLLVTTSLSTYYLPKLSSITSNKELRKEIFYGYKIILPIVIISCSVIFFMRFFIVRLLYSSEFAPMCSLFIYQLIGDFFKIASWLIAYLMLAKAMTRTFIITEIVSTITFVILGFVCTKIWGLQGITIAFMINYFLYLVIMIFIFRKLLVFNNASPLGQ